jgi:hypothetical protein
LYNARPSWAVAATALAVLGGTIGCLGLLIRKKWAFVLLSLSLIGILLQDFGLFALVNGAALAGSVAVLLQSFVLVIAIVLIWLSRFAIARGWLT